MKVIAHKLFETLAEMIPRRVVIEISGFIILGIGVFCGLALFSYDPSDATALAAGDNAILNRGGPMGARLAEFLLGSFGVISVIIALFATLMGTAMATGFLEWPRRKRYVGIISFVIGLSGLIHIQQIDPSRNHLPHGLGGWVGSALGGTLQASIGYGGAMIVLIFATTAALIVSGNLTFSHTARIFEYLWYWLQRMMTPPTARKPRRPTSPQKAAKPAKGKRNGSHRQKEEEAEEEPHFEMDLSSQVPKNGKPDIKIFKYEKHKKSEPTDFSSFITDLEAQLLQFKIEGKVNKVTEGPVVTTFELDPAPGVKAAKIVNVAEDLARVLKAKSLRVLPAIPGKSTIGLEMPSEKREIIRFGEVVNSSRMKSSELSLPLALGVDTFGKPIIEDLAQMPHLLLAGTTGSGKSVFVNNIIAGLLCRNSAKEMRFVFIDPKMVELAAFKDLPHLACPVVSDVKSDGMLVLDRLVEEMERRYEMMLSVEARNIKEFNETVRKRRRSEFPKFEGKWQPLPYVVLLIDEFADMILVLEKPAEEAITRLAQKARGAGIHLVIATQRPSVDVVTGLIKANFPTRIAFRVQAGADSRTIIDQVGAEMLLGKGDMLYQSTGGVQRVHAALLEDSELKKLLREVR